MNVATTTDFFFTTWRLYILVMLVICLVLKVRVHRRALYVMGPEERNIRRALIVLLLTGVAGVGGRVFVGISAPEWISVVLIVGGLVGLTVATFHIVYAHTRRNG